MDAKTLLTRMVNGARRWDAKDQLQWPDGIVRDYDEPHIESQHGQQLVQTVVDDEGICWRVAIQRVN